MAAIRRASGRRLLDRVARTARLWRSRRAARLATSLALLLALGLPVTGDAQAARAFPTPLPSSGAGIGVDDQGGTRFGLTPQALPTGGSAATSRYLHSGWNLIGWSGTTPIEAALRPIADRFDAAFTYDAAGQRFLRYVPGEPAVLNTLTTLRDGDGLLLHITALEGIWWPLPAGSGPRAVPLATGFNLITWTGDRQPVAQAVAGLGDRLVAAHAFDSAAQRYRTFRPSAPAFLSDLGALEAGQALWVEMRAPALWSSPPPSVQFPASALGDAVQRLTAIVAAGVGDDLPGQVLGSLCADVALLETFTEETGTAVTLGLAVLRPADPAGAAEAAAVKRSPVSIDRPLRGVVLTCEAGRVAPVPGAQVGTGERSLITDGRGRFTIPAEIRTDRLNVVAAGYWIVRRETTADTAVVVLPRLEARAIYLSYNRLRRQEALEWALDLARGGLISAIVVDVKHETGAVLPFVAKQTARDMNAVVDVGTDVVGFLDDLRGLGSYRIARVVAFRDNRFTTAFPSEAIHTADGRVLVDAGGAAWSDPFSERARRHNIEIGVNAAPYFEEIQYDYVRFPGDRRATSRGGATGAQRSAIIARFAADAAEALHAVGAALAFDTFGQTTVIAHDGGIGQVLEDLAPHLDYYSPMVYPSTWSAGWFGVAYPPADPFTIVRESVAAAVTRLEAFPHVVVRPWLQDFGDYQARKLPYGPEEVRAQIRAAAEAGAQGFMLWDPSLRYEVGVLAEEAREPEAR